MDLPLTDDQLRQVAAHYLRGDARYRAGDERGHLRALVDTLAELGIAWPDAATLEYDDEISLAIAERISGLMATARIIAEWPESASEPAVDEHTMPPIRVVTELQHRAEDWGRLTAERDGLRVQLASVATHENVAALLEQIDRMRPVVKAAAAWVDRCHREPGNPCHPNNWADEEDFAVMAAVDAYRSCGDRPGCAEQAETLGRRPILSAVDPEETS